MKKPLVQITRSPAETERFAARFAKSLAPDSIVLLQGELGAGKTTFIRGLARGLGVSKKVVIHSPSFTLVNEYPGATPLIHVDLYRLSSPREVEGLGLEDYFGRGVVAVEWAEKGKGLWPRGAVRVKVERKGPRERRWVISFGGQKKK